MILEQVEVVTLQKPKFSLAFVIPVAFLFRIQNSHILFQTTIEIFKFTLKQSAFTGIFFSVVL